jgi:hypothetical protein
VALALSAFAARASAPPHCDHADTGT